MNYMETYAYRPTGELHEILARLEEAGFGNTVETAYLRGLLETRRPPVPAKWRYNPAPERPPSMRRGSSRRSARPASGAKSMPNPPSPARPSNTR